MSLEIAHTAHVSLQESLDSIKAAASRSIGIQYCMILVKFDDEFEVADGIQAPDFIKVSVGEDAEASLQEIEHDFPIAMKVVRSALEHEALLQRSQRG